MTLLVPEPMAARLAFVVIRWVSYPHARSPEERDASGLVEAVMEVSAEIRWFWQSPGPADLKAWFTSFAAHGCAAGGGDPRTDAYLLDPEQAELGVKLRSGKSGVEVKGLVATIADICPEPPFAGPIEIWTKWPSAALSLSGAAVIQVNKRRWIRQFDTAGTEFREIPLDAQEHPLHGHRLPDEGCNVEYTEISVERFPPWVTFGLEAFGSVKTVVGNLCEITAQLSQRRPPTFTAGWCASYPVWLQGFAVSSCR
jgi:hypothetical protein